ncbi:Hypothetical protein HVR_LOCUS1050 [uncultured virus]|nr:Hypothetical protein HVR_LOCUS1050 [uncultured virus]
MALETITIQSEEEFAAWKQYWLDPARTEDEFMKLSVRLRWKGGLAPAFLIVDKGIFTPCIHASDLIEFINAMSVRFKVFVNGSGYSWGINEKHENGWVKNFPNVAGVILKRFQLWGGLRDVIKDTKIACVRYDGGELKDEEIAKSMSNIIKYLDSCPNRVIDIDIPIFISDLEKLRESLPKLQGVTIKTSRLLFKSKDSKFGIKIVSNGVPLKFENEYFNENIAHVDKLIVRLI